MEEKTLCLDQSTKYAFENIQASQIMLGNDQSSTVFALRLFQGVLLNHQTKG